MSKSKYPQELDTSAEIPAVRDNILEVGSDVINSLRSAIFNIERVLGINPQGATGNTLAERLSRALDGNGNIKSEALDRANVLAGPIVDADVSRVASIQESKLKLDYPTTLLQDEISVLNAQLDDLITSIESISSELSVHLNEHAINRHRAAAISVEAAEVEASDESLKTLEEGDVQSALEDIINKHINYTGEEISEENNSHTASQIFFDSTEIETIISSTNVQDAIVDLASSALNSQIEHQDLFHSNGMLRVGRIDTPDNTGVGLILAEDFEISFSKSIGSATSFSTITVEDTVALDDFDLKKSDILTITDASNPSASYVGSFEIESFSTVSGNISQILIYGFLPDDSTSTTRGRISKNIQVETSPAGLLATVREAAGLTSASAIQISNPNAVKVISSGIRPAEITTINRFLGVVVDDGSTEVIDLYDGTSSRQTINSIISRINEQAAESVLDFLAYRVDYENAPSELAIVHNLPDDEDETHTIKISRVSDDGIDAAGFSYIENETISATFGSSYYINGEAFEGLKVKIDTTELTFNAATIIVDSSASGIDFLESGVKAQDILTITDATNSADNGSYVITAVDETTLTLQSDQLPSGFGGASQTTTRFRIYSNIASFEDIIFNEVNGDFGATLADVFMDANQEVLIDKRFEYTIPILGSSSLLTLVDFKGEVGGLDFELVVSEGDDLINLTLDSGKTVEVRGDNSSVWITSGQYNVELKLFIPSIADLNTKIVALGTDLTLTFFGFDGVNQDSNLLIARVPFNNFNGRITGDENPRVFPILERGNVGLDEISNLAKKVIIEQPLRDLRSNGVVYGLEITNADQTDDLFSFDLERGVCYIQGRRIEISEKTSVITELDSGTVDKIFIAIDADGMIRAEACTPICDSPFEPPDSCILATVEFDGTTFYNIDLRLFIDELDLKVLNSITVSPQRGMAHFSELGKAIKYARRFSEVYPNAGTPTIHLKSGIHSVITEFDNSSITYADWSAQATSTLNTELYDGLFNAGLILDFPVNLIGEGQKTEIKLRSQYIFSDVTYNFRGQIGIVGDGFTSFTAPITKFTDGFIFIKDLKMDNCRFSLADFNINDGVDPFFMGVNFDSIIFHMRDFDDANPRDTSLGPRCITFTEADDTTTDKGNIIVNNCYFLVESTGSTKAVILVPDPTRAKNFIITNNRLLGSSSSSNIRLFDDDIWNFDDADSGANIHLVNNLAASNFEAVGSATNPHMIVGVSGWGDRISRSLKIGGDLEVIGDATSNSYAYGGNYTRTKNIFFESLSDTAVGIASPGTSFDNLIVNGRRWRTVLFPDATTDIMVVRLEILVGETLDDVNILFGTADPADAVFGGFSLKITSENGFGDETVEMAYTSMGSVTGSLGADLEAAAQGLSNLGLAGAANKNYLAYFKRTITTGFEQHMLQVQYTTTIATVEAIGGLS